MSMESLRFKKISMLEKRKWLLMNKTPPKLGNCPVMAMEISYLLAFVKLCPKIIRRVSNSRTQHRY
jgi:hypothetical protein